VILVFDVLISNLERLCGYFPEGKTEVPISVKKTKRQGH